MGLVVDDLRVLFDNEAMRGLDIPYLNAMANGASNSTSISIQFLHKGETVLSADVTMGTSSYDLRGFAVDEALHVYKQRTGEHEPPQFTHIKIEPHIFEAAAFAEPSELWSMSLDLRKHNDPSYLVSLFVGCGEELLEAFQYTDGNSHEYRSAARQIYKPLHAAYLYQTYDVQLSDGQGDAIRKKSFMERSLARAQKRLGLRAR